MSRTVKLHFRMEPRIFRELATYLRGKRLVVDTRITVEEKLGFFLYMLSHNASYEDLQVFFGHSNDTFHHHINHFFKVVIPALSRRYLQAPDPNQVHQKIQDNPRFYPQDNPRFYPFFKNCLGAIDGTRIPISIASEKASPFRNRKGTLSINVMVACDFDLNFTFISSGWEGSATDSRVLRSAMSKGFQVPPGKFYLVDGGYANRYHLKEFGDGHLRPQNPKELFNHRHTLLRNHVERALGVLKKRFPILKVATFHMLENQVQCCLADEKMEIYMGFSDEKLAGNGVLQAPGSTSAVAKRATEQKQWGGAVEQEKEQRGVTVDCGADYRAGAAGRQSRSRQGDRRRAEQSGAGLSSLSKVKIKRAGTKQRAIGLVCRPKKGTSYT
ncbi:unnamed protein product [Miscanthus lutarioriparius]|uniref:Transposase n=1 Tax=Miscanthus lutarioriparius TaxID=422564 RepID=A0A811SGG0_9POAL|nr:unnamed protein product [Miscanthus lutarioriparius]